MPVSLLTSTDATGHVHLIIGDDALAAARCARSLEVRARPIVIAPADRSLASGLQRRVEEGEVRLVEREFEDGDLFALGRDEVDGVVDAVFVTATAGSGHALSRSGRVADSGCTG